MGLIKSKYEKEIEDMMESLKLSISNNYKDNSKAKFKELEETLVSYISDGKIKGKSKEVYVAKYRDFQKEIEEFCATSSYQAPRR